MSPSIECQNGRALERIAPLFQRHNVQPRNYVSQLAGIVGLSHSQARRMLDKDIGEWSLKSLQDVYNHFGETLVCCSQSPASPHETELPGNAVEATVFMPSRPVKCQVVLDGELTGQVDDRQWVAYRKDGGLVVSELVEAPKNAVLFKVGRIELALRQTRAFSIAICDDNKDLADSLGDFLRDYGFSPSVFYSTADVEKAMADTVFDAFVLDWWVGSQTSESLIRLIRLAKSPTVPIFLITGKLNQGLSTEAEIADIVRQYHILPRDKPVRPSLLAAEILSAIQYARESPKPATPPSA